MTLLKLSSLIDELPMQGEGVRLKRLWLQAFSKALYQIAINAGVNDPDALVEQLEKSVGDRGYNARLGDSPIFVKKEYLTQQASSNPRFVQQFNSDNGYPNRSSCC